MIGRRMDPLKGAKVESDEAMAGPGRSATDSPGEGQTAEPRPWSTARQGMPLVDLHGPLAERVAALGATQINLYRALANAPDLLDAWLTFAWALREVRSTPRSLRELMILRTAVVMRSTYEWHQHRLMALKANVPADKIDAVSSWQSSYRFDDSEKAALMLTDAMLLGNIPDAVHDAVARHFDEQQRISLVMTAGFYIMVPRVLEALRVPPEGT